MLRRLIAALLVMGAVYFPVFWNSEGTLAQPARALRSAIAPNARDLMSNQYRQAEDANLVLNIQASNGIGKGFGVPIDYAIPIQDLSDISSMIDYVPHNGVLYVWMRMGLVGEIAFLSLVGAMVIRGCQLVKVKDRELALFGTLVVCAVLGYVVQGYNDMGFFWFRIALALGALLGGVEAALRLDRSGSGGGAVRC
jgi:O-antigen ligase